MKRFLREHLQLMELLICILFFMAGSLMAGSLFIRASQIQKESQELQSAVMMAQELAEKIRMNEDNQNEVYYFDNDWQPCGEADHIYQMVMKVRSEHTVMISIYRMNNMNTELIYELEAGGGL